MNDEALRYPTGKFAPQELYTKQELDQCIQRIESLPSRIEAIIKKFSAKDLETTYREGGWSARQVLHHVADSHTNAYIRFKWALTENTPVIKAYNEKLWAETPEVKLDPILSLNLLKALHAKWVALLKAIAPADLQKEYIHPETKKNVRLDRLIAMYAWHGDHHLGHLKIIAENSN
ncbi:MAG: putative metal-dependent hydrolase [Cyclobacteriaceae bacterium]